MREQILIPRQPFLVFTTTQYLKVNIMKYGISHFYKFNADSSDINLAEVFPDGSIDIMFRCNCSAPQSKCYGTRLTKHLLSESPIVEKGDIMFGVRFMPGNSRVFSNCNAVDFIENSIDLSLIIDNKKLIEDVCMSESFDEQINIFMKAYLEKYFEVKNNSIKDKRIEYYMLKRIIESNGLIRIKDLSQELVYSERYVNAKFSQQYGMSPKTFEKIIRLQNAFAEMDNCRKLTDVSNEVGYFDQSHMLKEFKQLLGFSPKKYLQMLKEHNYYSKIEIVNCKKIMT